MPVWSRMSPLQALKVRVLALAAPGVFLLGLNASPVQAATPDVSVTEMVNRLRSAPSKCASTPGLEKLVRRVELDRAASLLASGASPRDSAQESGYQSLGLQGIGMSGSTDLAALEQLLANGYCPLIADPRLADVGVHQQDATTWLVLAPAFAPAQGLDDQGISVRILQLVNQARAQARNCGDKHYPATGPVKLNAQLGNAARAHSEDMANNGYFSHTSRNGTTAEGRVERAGYDYRRTAENIAAGQMTPEGAMAGWLASPGHCSNLMDAGFEEMGVALASNRHSQMGAYWTQVFGTKRVARGAKPARPTRS